MNTIPTIIIGYVLLPSFQQLRNPCQPEKPTPSGQPHSFQGPFHAMASKDIAFYTFLVEEGRDRTVITGQRCSECTITSGNISTSARRLMATTTNHPTARVSTLPQLSWPRDALPLRGKTPSIKWKLKASYAEKVVNSITHVNTVALPLQRKFNTISTSLGWVRQ